MKAHRLNKPAVHQLLSTKQGFGVSCSYDFNCGGAVSAVGQLSLLVAYAVYDMSVAAVVSIDEAAEPGSGCQRLACALLSLLHVAILALLFDNKLCCSAACKARCIACKHGM